MRYTTSAGVVMQLGRIPRQHIDRFNSAHTIPEPPTVAVETWVDTENVPNYKDVGYQQDLNRYYLNLGREHVKLIVPAVTILSDVDFGELAELAGVGMDSLGDPLADFLRYVVDDGDAQAIVAQVFYQSTVTARGLVEASARYNVRWGKRQLDAFVVLGRSAGSYGAEFEARRAARFNGTSWPGLCEMSGTRQSDIVAFFRLNAALDWLQAKETRRK